jgi:hypothetical protein
MPFPSVLTSGNKATIRAGQYSTTPLLLVNPNDIVFAAQVNQATFSSPFASVTFDNVNGAYGAITDVLDGFTVYIGDTTDIRKATFAGRARGDQSAGTTLNINETDAALSDDQYITVVKDVAIREKLGRYVNNVMKVDWDITFRQLLPRVTGLKSAYVDVLASGQADFTFPAVGKATTSGATISSWLWNADGGTFVNGTSSTDAQPDIRYTTAGVYWPRVTVTDSGGRENWFTMPVFVASSDLSDSFIVSGIEQISITASIQNGYQMNFSYFSNEMETVAEQTLIALWARDDYNGDTDPILDNITFVGRLRRETTGHTVDNQYGRLPDTPFVCDGIIAQMGRLRGPQTAMVNDATPTEFGEIATMTQWRAASYILTEFSTITNVCSTLFDTEDNTYRNRQDSSDDNSILVSVRNLLKGINNRLNSAAQGELLAARDANFLSDTARNALDTITTFTENDTFNQRINREHVNTIGRVTTFAGGYNTTDDTLRVLRATAPAVASGEGQQTSTLNAILLDNDQTLTEQQAEIEQIAADALADKNPKDNVQLALLDGYYFLSPTNYQWYGYTGTVNDNNRQITYDSNDRFLLTSITIRFNNELGTWDYTGALTHETQGTDAQVVSQIAPGSTPTPLPAIPGLPAYPNFPALDSLYLPTGATEDDTPAVKQGDAEIIESPTDPYSAKNKGAEGQDTETLQGNVATIWSTDVAYEADNLGLPASPNWRTVWDKTSANIREFKYVGGTNKARILENDDTDFNSYVWNTENIRESNPLWSVSSSTIDSLEAYEMRITGQAGVIIYGISDEFLGPSWTINQLSGNGTAYLSPSDLITPHGSSKNKPAVYNSGTDKYDTVKVNADLEGRAGNVQMTIPPGTTLTEFSVQWEGQRVGGIGGERLCEISMDGVSIYTLGFGGGGAVQLLTSGPQVPSVTTGDTLLIHCSIDTALGYARLNSFQLKGTSVADFAATRYSDDDGNTFANSVSVGLMDLGDGSMDVRSGSHVLAAKNEQVKESALPGLTYDDADQGNTPSQFAKALRLFGDGSDEDYLLAPDGGSVGLYKIVNNVRTDITPNDGASDGVVVGPGGLDMSQVDNEHAWFLGNFGGTIKLAFTSNLQDVTPTWSFCSTTFSANAKYVRVKASRTDIVMVADNTTVYYSDDGGATVTAKGVPAAGIIGVEIK